MDLAESMADLAVLGTLLGLPSITDPMFPLAYSAFFGSLPMESPRRRGGGGVKEEGESLQAETEDDAPAVHAANVRVTLCAMHFDPTVGLQCLPQHLVCRVTHRFISKKSFDQMWAKECKNALICPDHTHHPVWLYSWGGGGGEHWDCTFTS